MFNVREIYIFAKTHENDFSLQGFQNGYIYREVYIILGLELHLHLIVWSKTEVHKKNTGEPTHRLLCSERTLYLYTNADYYIYI